MMESKAFQSWFSQGPAGVESAAPHIPGCRSCESACLRGIGLPALPLRAYPRVGQGSWRAAHHCLSLAPPDAGASASETDTELSNIVEADETYFLESFKGKRKLPRPARHRGGKARKRGLSAEQIPVLVAQDRQGKHYDAVLPKVDKQTLGSLLSQLLTPESVLCTDGAGVYRAVAKAEAIPQAGAQIQVVLLRHKHQRTTSSAKDLMPHAQSQR